MQNPIVGGGNGVLPVGSQTYVGNPILVSRIRQQRRTEHQVPHGRRGFPAAGDAGGKTAGYGYRGHRIGQAAKTKNLGAGLPIPELECAIPRSGIPGSGEHRTLARYHRRYASAMGRETADFGTRIDVPNDHGAVVRSSQSTSAVGSNAHRGYFALVTDEGSFQFA